MEYLTLLAVMLVAAACTTAVMPAFAAEYVVDMPEGTALTGCEVTDACFIPSSVTIDVGDEVTWTNSDIAAHTVASGSAQEGQSGLFNSGFVLAGGSFSVAFNDYEPGTYPYFCIVHPWRLGSVTVSGETADESDTGTTTPTGSGTGVIETDVQRVARLQSATSDHEERILALQEQINYIISELSRLVSLILAVQVELAALMLTDPEPIIVPEHNEVNTLELYIMTDKAAYGLNDTIRVTASQPMPVNVGPLPLDGSEPELTRMQYQLGVYNTDGQGEAYCRIEVDVNTNEYSVEYWDYEDTATCLIDENGLLSMNVTVPGDWYAGQYRANMIPEIGWTNYYYHESIESQPFIVQ